jgi:hypothetical protein
VAVKVMDQITSNNTALDNLVGELQLIHDLTLRNFITRCILTVPGTYWYRPSAYFHHASDELHEWGSLIHTKRTIVVATIFVNIENLDSLSSDALYSALILHDVGKYGVDGKTERIRTDHAELITQIYPELRDDLYKPIASIVKSHMGRWGLSKPITQLEHLGHYSDCIASRTSLNISIKLK